MSGITGVSITEKEWGKGMKCGPTEYEDECACGCSAADPCLKTGCPHCEPNSPGVEISPMAGKMIWNGVGVFQDVWDKWNEVDSEVKALPPAHFASAIIIQVGEALECVKSGDTEHQAKEVVDTISVCFNWLRNMGYTPDTIPDLVRGRLHRYTNPKEILEKYRSIYGI